MKACGMVRRIMMTWLNGNISRVTGPLCGEFTSDRWIPHTKASDNLLSHTDCLDTGRRLNIKMSSYQHRDFHYKDKTVSQPYMWTPFYTETRSRELCMLYTVNLTNMTAHVLHNDLLCGKYTQPMITTLWLKNHLPYLQRCHYFSVRTTNSLLSWYNLVKLNNKFGNMKCMCPIGCVLLIF